MTDRRRFISGALAGGLAATGLSACGGGSAKHGGPLLVLVPGSLHSSFCWARVTPYLVMSGLRVLAIDLPGTGLNARFPVSAYARPFDSAAYLSEVSPDASITLADYVNSVGNLVDQLHQADEGPIVLVGHSLGGLTLNAVGESRSSKIAGLIYLSGVMIGNNESLIPDLFSKPGFGDSYIAQGRTGGIGDPAVIGASRVDLNTPDPQVRATIKAAYCADASDADFAAWANMLVTDDPVAPLTAKIALTAKNWGSLRRAYIKCSMDHIVPPTLADSLIAAADAFTPKNKTVVRTLESSHSSFLSKPKELAAILADLVGS